MTERKQQAEQTTNRPHRQQALRSALHRANHLRYGADAWPDELESLPGEPALSRQAGGEAEPTKR
jgi:hypothetical protein